MRGPFGGELLCEEGGACETALGSGLLPILGEVGDEAGPGADPEPVAAPPGDGDAAATVCYWRSDESIVYGGDLRDLSPLEPGIYTADHEEDVVARQLGVLARVLYAIGAMHADGRVHGDLRPGTVWVGEDWRTTLLVPAAGLDAPALLAARLRGSGALPSAVAFAAPEVAEGSAATPASDVYAVAAMAFAVLSGRRPLGRLRAEGRVASLSDESRQLLIRALDADPTRRPLADELALSFRAAAELLEVRWAVCQAEGRSDAEVPDGGITVVWPSSLVPVSESLRRTPLLLILVLIVSGLFVFFGVLGFVVANWQRVGEVGLLALLAVATAGLAGGGLLLERSGFARSGFAMIVLGSALLWVDLFDLLVIFDAHKEAEGWALGSVPVVGVHFLLGARRRSVFIGLGASVGFAVTALTFGQVISTDSLTGPAVYNALVAIAYLGIAWLGVRCGGGRPLGVPFSIGSLIWAWASAIASLFVLAEVLWRPHLYAGSLLLFGQTWPLALCVVPVFLSGRLRQEYRTVCLVAASGLLLVGPSGVAAAFMGADAVSYLYAAPVFYLALAVAFQDRGASPVLIFTLGVAAVGWCWGSSLDAIGSLDGSSLAKEWPGPLVATAWPYLVAGGHVAVALRWSGSLRKLCWVAAVGILGVAPTAQALVCSDQQVYLLGAVAVGLGLLGAAFWIERVSRSLDTQVPAVLVGLVCVCLAPVALCLQQCMGRDGFALVREAIDNRGVILDTRLFYLSAPLGVSAGLVALGYLFTPRAVEKVSYRLVESAGLVIFFGILTLLSLPDCDAEFFYIGLLLTGGLVILGFGLWGHRAMLVGFASVALLLNLLIQYFAKLWSEFHWGLIATGFGLILMGLAILYERKVKHVLPALRSWA